MNPLEISVTMPHGHPMLLVDAACEGVEAGSAIAFKNITFNEPCFRCAEGAVSLRQLAYPLALLVESFGQGAGLLLAQRGFLAGARSDAVVVFGEFRDIEIVGDAYPGDRLCHEVQIDLWAPIIEASGVSAG